MSTASDGSITDTNSQPAPKPNDKPAVWSMVMRDMVDRDIFGAEKYRTRLQPGNGRDFLVDAYQEALDLVVYLRGAIYERDNTEADHARRAMSADFGQQNQLSGSALAEAFGQVNTLNTLASNEINSSAKLTPTIKQNLTVAGEVPPLWATHLLENKNKGRAWAKFQHGNYISKLGRVYNLHRWSVVKQLFTTDKLSDGKFKSGGFTGKGCAVMSASAGPMLRCPDCIAEHCSCIAS